MFYGLGYNRASGGVLTAMLLISRRKGRCVEDCCYICCRNNSPSVDQEFPHPCQHNSSHPEDNPAIQFGEVITNYGPGTCGMLELEAGS